MIAPYSTGRVGLRFALPRGVTASDVAEFELDWRLESPEGNYEQSTRFVAEGTSPMDARLGTCVGANGFNTSDDCKDTNALINR